MSRSYKKHPMMVFERRPFNHKDMNRSFRRTPIESTPANGNAYKKYGRVTNRYYWKPFYTSRVDAIEEWKWRERTGSNYDNLSLEEWLLRWEKWCRRK